MTPSTLLPSEPKLSEVARHLVYPDGIVTSTWPQVEKRLATVDVLFDRWQQGFASLALGCRKDGKYAATIGGVVASIPRQVGKTFTVGHLLIGLALEHPGLRIIWTSHHARTTTNTFRSMQGMVSRPKMAPLIAPNGIRVANGEQEIRFRNGSILMFGAREYGFGRGMDAIDIEVFDEAQILSLKALEDMVPATNQAKHRHGALVFFIGTPPRPGDDGEAFTAKRTAALEGRTADQFYVELSADPDADSDDRSQWEAMNPSYPARTPLESMLRMRENIPDEESWRREAMGIWDVESAESVIDMAAWSLLDDATGERPSPVAFGVAMSLDRAWCSIALAGRRPDGLVQVQIVQSGRGGGWVPDRLAELKKWRPIGPTLIEAGSPAASLTPALDKAKVKYRLVGARDYAGACGSLMDAMSGDEPELRHAGQPVLTVAAGAARRKARGDVWTWSEPKGTDVSPLRAVTLAHLALTSAPDKPRSPTRVVVMR